MVNSTTFTNIGEGASVTGNILGKSTNSINDFVGKFTSYIINMGVVMWIILIFFVIGSFISWYLISKYNLKLRWGPKKPNNKFN